ncbi:MAG: hypothetical protein HKN12_06260, partial [Gemmatimonadetes bacterium]|nr:hypothetical protein [Gemmatimonadota bacterium]
TALLAAAEDPSARVRVRALRAIPEFRPRGGRAALRRAARSADARVATVAAKALERLAAPPAQPSGSSA